MEATRIAGLWADEAFTLLHRRTVWVGKKSLVLENNPTGKETEKDWSYQDKGRI